MGAREDIISALEEHGPLLPVDISKITAINTWVLRAFLSEMVEKGEICESRTRIGNAPLYYLPAQRDLLEAKIMETLSSEVRRWIEIIRENKVVFDEEIPDNIKSVLRELNDLVEEVEVTRDNRRFVCWVWYDVDDSEIGEIISDRSGNDEDREYKETADDETESKKDEKKMKSHYEDTEPDKIHAIEGDNEAAPGNTWPGNFLMDIASIFARHRIKTIERYEVERNRIYKYIVSCPSPFGEQKYMVFVRNREEPMGVTELISCYMEALEHKLPVVFISSSGFTEKTVTYYKNNFPDFAFLITKRSLRM